MLAQKVQQFGERGVQIVPVLAQRADAVRRYVEDTGLPFNVLIDERRDTVRAYGVWHRVGLDAWNIARPAWFLIERDGRVSWSFIGDRQTEHPDDADLSNAIAREADSNQS